MRFVVLGPVAAFDGAYELPLGGPRQRAVLALMLIEPGRAIRPERFLEEVWGDQADGMLASLYTYVSNLRRVVGGDRIRHGSAGYLLDLADGDELDSLQFSAAVAAAGSCNDAQATATALQQALEQWRGRPFEGLEDIPSVAVEIVRLDELRASAEMDLLEARLRTDEGAPVAEAMSVRDRRPLDERAWSLFMRSLYRAGRHADAVRAAQDFRSLLAEELGLDPSPALIHLEEQILLHDEDLDHTARVGRISVPTYLTTFVGRTNDLQEAAAALDNHRLTTITGPGGVGKTRLAVELAAATRTRFPNGTWLVDLARIADPQRISGAIAATIQAAEAGDGEPLDGMVRALDGRRVLLILDNAEHLREHVADVVRELLGRLDLITILVTSRVPIGVPGERLVQIAGLEIGTAATCGDAERLFLERCADRTTIETTEPTESVRSICTHLDGMPLALELAASRSSSLTTPEIADLLTRRFAILIDQHQPRDLHRSLEATLGWSYGLLSTNERAAFSALGVFDGPFTAEAAAAAFGSTDDDDARRVLERLVQSSLVTTTPTADGHMMYRLLETLRAYPRDRLKEEARWDEPVGRHDQHYRQLASRLSDEFLGGGRVAATARIACELDNHLAAWDRLVAIDPIATLPSGWALGNVWLFQGNLADGERRLNRLLEATSGDTSVARADVLVITSWLITYRNQLGRARALADEAVCIYRGAASDERLAFGLARAGHMAFAGGDGQAAMPLLYESLELCDRIGFEDGKAWPVVLIAQARRWSGDGGPEVREMLLDARRRFIESGETYGQIHTDMLLTAFKEFPVDERVRIATEMVDLSEGPGGENLMRPIALHNLAYAIDDTGDHERAAGINRAAVRSSMATGATMNLGLALLQAATFAAGFGKFERAATLLGAGATHFGMEMAPFQLETLGPVIEAGRSSLGNDQWDELGRIGAAMSADEAAHFRWQRDEVRRACQACVPALRRAAVMRRAAGIAASSPAALLRHSRSSSSGTLSATMPAPAWRLAITPSGRMNIVRMAIAVSRLPDQST